MSGITPAYAGSTLSDRRQRMQLQDHPRIRGKYLLIASVENAAPGSPPHTREVQETVIVFSPSNRITPAYAGSTQHAKDGDLMVEDHPRIRGKYES